LGGISHLEEELIDVFKIPALSRRKVPFWFTPDSPQHTLSHLGIGKEDYDEL